MVSTLRNQAKVATDIVALIEWEAKPTSPDSIRLISMGKLLTDKSKLSGKSSLRHQVANSHRCRFWLQGWSSANDRPHDDQAARDSR